MNKKVNKEENRLGGDEKRLLAGCINRWRQFASSICLLFNKRREAVDGYRFQVKPAGNLLCTSVWFFSTGLLFRFFQSASLVFFSPRLTRLMVMASFPFSRLSHSLPCCRPPLSPCLLYQVRGRWREVTADR